MLILDISKAYSVIKTQNRLDYCVSIQNIKHEIKQVYDGIATYL